MISAKAKINQRIKIKCVIAKSQHFHKDSLSGGKGIGLLYHVFVSQYDLGQLNIYTSCF